MPRRQIWFWLTLALLAAGACSSPAKKPPFKPVEQRLTIMVERFQFIPSSIEVEKGKPVSIKLKSNDRAYVVSIPEEGLRTSLPAGKDATLRFTPRQPGKLTLECTGPSGTDCDNMRGTIRVK